MYHAYTSKSMVQCPNCARKFLEDRLHVHLRSCTAENPCKSVKVSNHEPQEDSKQTKQIPITSQSMNFKSSRVVASNSASFQGIPTKQSIIEKYISSSKVKSIESEIEGTNEFLRDERSAAELEYQTQADEDPRIACPKCDRKFNPDRIAKHQEICKLDIIEPKKSTEEKKVISKSPEPKSFAARTKEPDTTECPYCSRKFDHKVAERHIPKCKDIVNRPSPPQNKLRSTSQISISIKEKPSVTSSIDFYKSAKVPATSENQSISQSTDFQASKPGRDPAEKIFCHNCGEKYFPNSKFCSFCGEKK